MKTSYNEQTMIDLDALPPISATKISDTKEEKISATKYMNQYKKEKYGKEFVEVINKFLKA